jgi:hypothetical protein
MKRVRIDYPVYSANYQPGEGECWDFTTVRGARAKARKFGVGAVVVRNFNQADRPGKSGDWWQTSFCWLWNGVSFRKAYPVLEEKWVVAENAWFRPPLLPDLVSRTVDFHQNSCDT